MQTTVLDLPDYAIPQSAGIRDCLLPHRLSSTLAITAARYVIDSPLLPLVQDALPFAEQVRRALIRSRVDTSHSEAIVGKTVDGVPLAGHLHAHYLATDEDGDGWLDHGHQMNYLGGISMVHQLVKLKDLTQISILNQLPFSKIHLCSV